MGIADVVRHLLGLLAGIGVFLIAIKLISVNLEAVGGNRLKSLFAKTSKSDILGIGIGASATALIQSSGATSVMTIGFVNARVMSLAQGCAIVLGANIGTTITAQIVALGFLGASILSASVILASLSGIGALMMYFASSESGKKIGGLLAGFGILFVGLSMMSTPMSAFANVDSVKNFIASINFPGCSFVLYLVGIVLTAIIQSSSVTSSISITMLVSGLISLDQGIFLILGANVGACVVAIMACVGTIRKAKAVAYFHLIENIVRSLSFLLLLELARVIGDGFSIATIFQKMFPTLKPFQLSMFHTLYNVVTVLLLWPFMGVFVKLAVKMLPGVKSVSESDEEEIPETNRLYYIDIHMLKTPPIAVQQTKNEVVNMADIAIRNFGLACDIICTMDYSKLDQFRKNEQELNFLNRELTNFVVHLSKMMLSEEDHVYLSTVYRTVSDLERIGDYAENIIEYADKLNTSHELFSEDAIAEIRHIRSLIDSLFDNSMKAYIRGDITQLDEVNRIEEKIDAITEEMAANHIARLGAGICTPDVGAQYLSLAANAERVADHLVNVANTVKHSRELKSA